MLEPMKSQVEIYFHLLEQMLHCDPCGLTSSKHLTHDLKTLEFRYHHEGLSFLTKSLPLLGKSLDRGLSTMLFEIPDGFKKSKRNPSIPAFMQTYFNNIFDELGALRDSARPDVVKHLRQVLFFAYKLEIPYSAEQLSQSLDSFVSTDAELDLVFDEETTQILNVASFITERVFRDFNVSDITPRHGPGAVATGEKLEDKWIFHRLYNSIHQVYPYYDYFIVGGGAELEDRKEWYMSLARLDQGQAKVIAVPKDSRGPRLISCEPLEYQWIQQGLGRKIMSHLESFWMTSGHINFELQSINRDLALINSQELCDREVKRYATIDLKDASDRVSMKLVDKVFERVPNLLKALHGCRTSATLLPDGRVVEFQKFAPMGSALCFPIEAYIFWVLLVAAYSRHRRVRQADVIGDIFVYGDDIIIPVSDVSLCIQTFESVGLRVNRSKCCIHGPFRESCGMDAFKGTQVTPTRLKKLWSGRPTDGSAYVSYIEIANILYANGYVETSDYLWKELESVYGRIPYGTVYSSFPCRIIDDPEEAESRNLKFFKSRLSRRYQRVEFFLPRLVSSKKVSKLDSWPRLLRNMTMRVFEDPQSIVLPRSIILKRGWTAIF